MVKVSIVILNWNREKDTIECLESIEKLDTKSLKVNVIVVDNGSKKATVKAIKDYMGKGKFPTTLFVMSKNLGFTGGNNFGINKAMKSRSKYVMVLNNDTLVDKNLLQGFIKTAEKYKKAGIMSPKIYFAKGFEFHKDRYKKSDLGKVIWYAGGDIDWDNVYGSNHGVDEVDKGQFDKESDTDFATGACSFIRTKAIREVGLYSDKYYMYMEDDDLSMRMKDAGWRVMYAPKGYLWHKVAQSTKIGSNQNDYFLTRNRLMFGLKYASFRAKLALVRESIKLVISGRDWQKKGVKDYYGRKFGKGSWNE